MRPVPCGLMTQRPWVQSITVVSILFSITWAARRHGSFASGRGNSAEGRGQGCRLRFRVPSFCGGLNTLQHWPSAALIYMYLHIPPVYFSNCSSPYIYAEWGNGQEHEDYYVVSCTGLQLSWEWAHGVSG